MRSKNCSDNGASGGWQDTAWGRSNPFHSVISAASSFSGRFARDEGGAVILLVGLVIIVLCLFVGLSFDSARGYLLKSKLSGALDAAGLAGARVMDLSDSERNADINAFFRANFPSGFMGATTPALTISENADGDQLTLTATSRVRTTLMRLLGYNDMTVSARAVIHRAILGLEVMMVLDNTYSMNSSGKIGALKDAATSLINILYGGEETASNLWVGLVPFVHSVNVGNQHTDWLVAKDPSDPSYPHVNTSTCSANPTSVAACEQRLSAPKKVYSGGPWDSTLYYYDSSLYDYNGSGYTPANIRWKGCVEARIRPDDGSDYTEKAEDPPSVRAFRPYFYPDSRVHSSSWSSTERDDPWNTSTTQSQDEDNNGGRGPNIGCAQPIQPLTASRSIIQTAIDDMTVWNYGGTAIKLGLAWGWRAISPEWKGLWDASTPNLPLDYDAPNMDKAIILLTDGVQQFYAQSPSHPDGGYNSHGRVAWGRLHDADGTSITSASPAEDELDRRLSILCEAVKAKGIRLYTIVLQHNDPDLQTLFRNCATKPEYYFESPTASDLQDVFEKIANDLSTLRIEQ